MDPHWFQYRSGSCFLVNAVLWIRSRDLMTKSCKLQKMHIFLKQKLQHISHFAFTKDTHTTGEAISPQPSKDTSRTLKKKLHFHFFLLCRTFLPTWIRIQSKKNLCRSGSGSTSTTLSESFSDVKFIADRWSVLQIRDVYPGSRISDSHQRI